MDRLLFTKHSLMNGCTLWVQPVEVPIVHVQILIPIGNAHAHEENVSGVQGISHFLEHACFERSILFPERDSFENHLAERGGSWNAWTQAHHTVFELQVPAIEFANLLPGFLSHVFDPIFVTEDIEVNRRIIRNERLQQEKYYPGDNEMSAYRFNQWMHTRQYPLEQVFGTDADLKLLNEQTLKIFHKNYRSSDIQVVAAGDFNEDILIVGLEQIQLHKPSILTTKVESIGWAHQEFHTMHTKDIEFPLYSLGGNTTEATLENIFSISFILNYLVDTHLGALNSWLRKEKGWSYGVTSAFWYDKDRIGWVIDVPVSDVSVLPELRADLHGRISTALKDKSALTRFKEYVLRSRGFQFQTIESRVESASDSVIGIGRIISEQEYERWLHDYSNSDFLIEIYKRYFATDVTGELLFLPQVSPKI